MQDVQTRSTLTFDVSVCFRWTAQGAMDIEIIDYH